MRKQPNIAPVVFGGLALGLLLWLAQSEEERDPAPAKRKPDPEPPPPPPPAISPDSRDDETALARVLASEDSRRELRIVIAWITWQRAKRSKKSIYDFVTSGLGYGRNERSNGVIVNASTHEKPTAETRQIAREVMAGRLYPSEAIRKHRPGSWVERDVLKSLDDEAIIKKQTKWKEGIYAQILGSKWVLYSSDVPPIQIAPFKSAKQRLDALPRVAAVD